LGRLILNSGRAAARPYIRLDRIYSHMQLTTWNCSSQHTELSQKRKIGSFPAKRALRPGAIFASIATWDVLPSLASADAFRCLASYSVLSNPLPAIPDHGSLQKSRSRNKFGMTVLQVIPARFWPESRFITRDPKLDTLFSQSSEIASASRCTFDKALPGLRSHRF